MANTPAREMPNRTEKAKFSYMGRDLYWKLYDHKDGFIRWSGYDDANWWNNVAPKVRDRVGPETGRTYRIDFESDTVEIIEGNQS
jgi:hypothetical protein